MGGVPNRMRVRVPDPVFIAAAYRIMGRTSMPSRATSETATTADLLTALPDAFAGNTVRLRELLAALGDRGMASALLLTTLPQLLPLPLGLSNLLSLPILVVAVQMALGRTQPWLPGWLLDRSLHRQRLDQACNRVTPLLRRTETLICPRLRLLWSSWGIRLTGLSCLTIALVLLAPLPLTGWLPAWALLLVGVGMLERDGLVLLAGLALGAAAVGVFIGIVTGLASLGG
jgi:hypothetical protein